MKLPTKVGTAESNARSRADHDKAADADQKALGRRGKRVRASAERLAEEALGSQPLAPTQPKKIARPKPELARHSKPTSWAELPQVEPMSASLKHAFLNKYWSDKAKKCPGIL